MPRIKAYSGAGKLIPVDEAKVKTAFRCPWTNTVFAAKRDYVKHLSELRTKRIYAKIAERRHDMLCDDLHNQHSFEDVIRWIELHPDFMWHNIGHSVRGQPMPQGFGVRITYLNLIYSTQVSNSHTCPRGGHTNWSRKNLDPNTGKPMVTHYPGWTGRIEYQVMDQHSSVQWGSDAMRSTGILTGTGGGMSRGRYGYGVTFWADDWPSMKMLRSLTEDGSLDDIRIGKTDYFA